MKNWVSRSSYLTLTLLRADQGDSNAFAAELENRPKSAHRYNVAQQQAVYRSEIDRIWKAQFDSLSSSVPPILVEEDEKARERYHGAADTPYSAGPATPGDGWNRRRNSMSPASSRGMTPDRDDAMSVGSRGYGGAYGANKLLKIRRLVGDRQQSSSKQHFLIMANWLGLCRWTANGRPRSFEIPRSSALTSVRGRWSRNRAPKPRHLCRPMMPRRISS